MALPPAFPASFYRLLAKGAERLGVSRIKFVMEAMRYYLHAKETKSSPMVKALGSEELAEKYGEARRKIAKKWWATVSEEEKMERIRKANAARWGKKKS